MKYRLFYNFHVIGDVLIIIFDEELKYDEIIKRDNLITLKNNNKIIGYNILNFSEIVKIKAFGMIVLPPNELIDVINTILINNNCEKLDYQQESGFIYNHVREIIPVDDSVNYLKLDSINSIPFSAFLMSSIEVAVDDIVVISTPLNIISNGKTIKEFKIMNYTSNTEICSYLDLGISADKNIYKSDSLIESGLDFFKEE